MAVTLEVDPGRQNQPILIDEGGGRYCVEIPWNISGDSIGVRYEAAFLNEQSYLEIHKEYLWQEALGGQPVILKRLGDHFMLVDNKMIIRKHPNNDHGLFVIPKIDSTKACLYITEVGAGINFKLKIVPLTNPNLYMYGFEYSPGALTSKSAISNGDIIWENLKTAGSSANMRIDGSLTPVSFYYTVPPGKQLLLTLFQFWMASTSTFIDETKFGSINALANGLQIKINNFEMAGCCFKNMLDLINKSTILTSGGAISKEDKSLLMQIQFPKILNGLPVVVEPGNKVEIIVQDDLDTGFTSMTATIGGFLKGLQE